MAIMADLRSAPLKLHRAENGHDLWTALEASQYAKLIEHDEPLSTTEAGRMRDLIGFFSSCAEDWENRSASDQSLALEQLGIRLTALQELELHVYSAITKARFDTADGAAVHLPLAVVTILHDDRSTILVTVPRAFGVDGAW